MTTGTIILICIWLLVIAWVVNSARKRGRDPVLWGIVAALIGIFAFIPLLIAGTSREGHLRQIKEDERARAQVLAEIKAEEEVRQGVRHAERSSIAEDSWR